MREENLLHAVLARMRCVWSIFYITLVQRNNPFSIATAAERLVDSVKQVAGMAANIQLSMLSLEITCRSVQCHCPGTKKSNLSGTTVP